MRATRLATRLLPMLLLLLAGGCSSTGYLLEQGRGQLRILRARRRISDVLADPATPGSVKARLRLAAQAREFGVRVLGLRGGDAYTRYLDTGDQPIAWSVYAAYPDRLKPYLHRFPIAGAVPYLGFFEKPSAVREKARLDAMGLDTYLVPVAGYSTLGYTADPISSSMLEGSHAGIVEVVLHEMLHGTVYRPGHSEWNESLATMVGCEGAAAFFAGEQGGAGEAGKVLEEARERDRHLDEFSAFIKPVIAQLETLYAEPIPQPEKLVKRRAIFERAMADYRVRFPPRPDEQRARAFARQPLNNAVVLAFDTYHGSEPSLRAELAADGGDLTRLIARYKSRYGR